MKFNCQIAYLCGNVFIANVLNSENNGSSGKRYIKVDMADIDEYQKGCLEAGMRFVLHVTDQGNIIEFYEE